MVKKIMGVDDVDEGIERNYAVLADKLHRRAEAHANG